ncbi:DUF4439 domain-containing protein [Arthrobacter sp. 1P04PC]|uniref:DUF4439 domain-containing protein n=1 Tax=unclassified Arthrobacter TaxID=235627 RepID=UPI0039A22B7D
MNEETSGERRRARLPRNLPRLALIVVLAVVVLTLGLVVRPGKPAEPAPPTASERALAAALTDTLELRSAAERLTGAGTAADGTVSFLTTQARALWRPGSASTPASTSLAPSGAASPGQSPSSASPSPASASPSPASASPSPASVTAASLVTALDASGRQRLADAAAADPGTARLLASVGTGQLLQASALAAATGTPDPSTTGAPASAPTSAAPATGSATPSPSACPSATDSPWAAPSASASPARADLANALAEVISTERETVYAYQVALTRLDGPGAAAAATRLTRHEALAAAAEALSRQHCAAAPPRQAGYALDPAFLASPAAGLRALESGSLAAYADLVGLSDGSTRQWAVSGLLEAGRRAAAWGAAPEPTPGLSVDPAELPTLPAAVAG